MMDDGVKGQGKDEEVRVQDIAELVLEALENEDRTPAPVTGEFRTGYLAVLIGRARKPSLDASPLAAASG